MSFFYSIFMSLMVIAGVVPQKHKVIKIYTPQDCVEEKIFNYAYEYGVSPTTQQVPKFRETCWEHNGAEIMSNGE